MKSNATKMMMRGGGGVCWTCVETDVHCSIANEAKEGKADGDIEQLLAQLYGRDRLS